MVTCSLYWTHTWRPVKLGSVLVLHLKASQTRFYFGLTLESQLNLVLFRSYTWKPVKLGSVPVWYLKASQTCSLNFYHMSIYLDLPFTASLVALLTLPRISTWLDLHLRCQCEKASNPAQLGSGPFEKFDLFENIFFLPEGLSKAFIECITLLTLHLYFRQENIYPMQMCYAMYDHEWHVWVFELVFHLSLFCSSVLGFFCFSSPMGPLRACSSSLSCFYPLFGKHLPPWRLLFMS